MGLDATVYCNCYKTGKIKTPPPHQELVEFENDGEISIITDDDNKYFEFEDWKKNACEHTDMKLIHYRLGNISAIGHVKSLIENISVKKEYSFPVLMGKVIYSGSHAGDHLDLPDVAILITELNIAKEETTGDPLTQETINNLLDLCEKALSVENPIVF